VMSGGVADRLCDRWAAVSLVSDIVGLSEFLRTAASWCSIKELQLSLPASWTQPGRPSVQWVIVAGG